MNIKTETWNGHRIRFVENGGEWWAVAKDVSDALGYANSRDAIKTHVSKQDTNTVAIRDGNRGNPNRTTVNEFGIYKLVFSSELPEAENFQRWVFGVIKELREAAGLEGYHVFRMMDKEHQTEAMRRLQDSLRKPKQHDYIKANTIANKAVSTLYGLPKMIGKEQMTPEMLLVRQPILDDTVNLMTVNESFGMGLSVSRAVYEKYCVTGG